MRFPNITTRCFRPTLISMRLFCSCPAHTTLYSFGNSSRIPTLPRSVSLRESNHLDRLWISKPVTWWCPGSSVRSFLVSLTQTTDSSAGACRSLRLEPRDRSRSRSSAIKPSIAQGSKSPEVRAGRFKIDDSSEGSLSDGWRTAKRRDAKSSGKAASYLESGRTGEIDSWVVKYRSFKRGNLGL